MACPHGLNFSRSRRQAAAVGLLAALAVGVRPTAAIHLPAVFGCAILCGRFSHERVPYVASTHSVPRLVLLSPSAGGIDKASAALLASSCAIGLTLLFVGIDRLCYGVWVLPPLNFLRFNLLTDGSSYYGIHPWHWYGTNALPTLLAAHTPLVILGVARSTRHRTPLVIAASVLVVLSLSPHKELRFLCPVLPLLLCYAALALRSMPSSQRRRWLVALFVVNAPAATYLSRWHQRAPLDLMRALRVEAVPRPLPLPIASRLPTSPPPHLPTLHCSPFSLLSVPISGALFVFRWVRSSPTSISSRAATRRQPSLIYIHQCS